MNSVCVFCGSSPGANHLYLQAATATGDLLARRGLMVVYGGGRVGLMGALADAAIAAEGKVIGVIPKALVSAEVAHFDVTDLKVVDSMHERKALMSDLSDGFIALPGGLGTFEEFFEVLTWAQLGIHSKPIGLLNVAGYFDRLLDFIRYAADEGFIPPRNLRLAIVGNDPQELLDRMEEYRAPIRGVALDNKER